MCGTLKSGTVRVLALIAIWLISITTGVGTAVFCYGSDHTQAESLFAACCNRGYGSTQKPSRNVSSVQSEAALTQGSSSCGPCIDVPLNITQQEGVSAPVPSTSSSSLPDLIAAVISPSGGELLNAIVLRSGEKPDPIPSLPLSSSTVLRC